MTGALQDHDRGLVVGETTWGKALVQSIYRLSEGRRPRADDGALLHARRPADSAPVGRELRRIPVLYDARSGSQRAAHAVGAEDTLRLGRKVYSGGGIEPDYRMAGPIEGFNPGKFARRLHPTMFANYAQRFDREGDTGLAVQPIRRRRRTLTREFTVDDAMLQDFKAFVKSQLRDASQFDEAGFNADVEFIRRCSATRSTWRCSMSRRRAGTCSKRSAGAIRADALPGGGEAVARARVDANTPGRRQ